MEKEQSELIYQTVCSKRSSMKELILKLRLKMDCTQQQIADKIGVSSRLYGYYETGQRRPGKRVFLKIKRLAEKHLSQSDMKMVELYEEQLFSKYSTLLKGYKFLDVENLLKDFHALKKQNEKLRIENKAYKQILSDLDIVFANIIKGKKKKVVSRES